MHLLGFKCNICIKMHGINNVKFVYQVTSSSPPPRTTWRTRNCTSNKSVWIDSTDCRTQTLFTSYQSIGLRARRIFWQRNFSFEFTWWPSAWDTSCQHLGFKQRIRPSNEVIPYEMGQSKMSPLPGPMQEWRGGYGGRGGHHGTSLSNTEFLI